MSTLQAKLETGTLAYQAIQQELAIAVETRQRLDSQMRENEIVQKEFGLLKSDANIYKLIGPVLVKQDRHEAIMNVDKRIEFIKAEIDKMEKQLKELTEKQEKQRDEIVSLQIAYQNTLTSPAK